MWSQSFLVSSHFSSPPKLSIFSASSFFLIRRCITVSVLPRIHRPKLGSISPRDTSISRFSRSCSMGCCWIRPIPSQTFKEKAGANALFEEPNNGSNNIGVVVSHVRIKSLEEFGTPQFVADKLHNAEQRKESTKEVEVVSVGERSGGLQKQVYEFEYKIDSTRGGIKRVFSTAFASSNKLYLLNVVHLDKPENPLDSSKRLFLEQVLHSFDALPLQ